MKQFPKLMIVDGTVEWFETEEELITYVWEIECEQASGGDFDEDEEEWSDFVARNSSVTVEEYDETDHKHKMLSGAEDKRPGILEYQKTARREKQIKYLEGRLMWQAHKNKVDSELLQKGIDAATKLMAELEALLDT